MIWQLLQIDTTPEANWWLKTYVSMAQGFEIDNSYRPRGGAFTNYSGYLWQFVQEKVTQAYSR